MSATPTAECVADVHALLGEGPVWVEREAALYWLDIKGRTIFRLRENGQLEQWPTPFRIGSIVPRASGGFIGGTDEGIAGIDLEANRFEILLRPEEHLPDNRFNDGKVDRSGNFWAGTMDDNERAATGRLYRFDAELRCAVMDDGYKVTNGPAFSPDGATVYHNDSARQVTYRFQLGDDGSLSGRETFLRFDKEDGYPDGMTVDAENCLWIAFWEGGCIRRFSPAGERIRHVDMPVSRPTSCAFGGPRLDRLYVTSASIGLSDEQLQLQPNAGGLFMVDAGVQGIAEIPYAG